MQGFNSMTSPLPLMHDNKNRLDQLFHCFIHKDQLRPLIRIAKNIIFREADIAGFPKMNLLTGPG